jgi:hypothetical protein
MCPYNQTDDRFHGFLGTHQPAIWMGEASLGDLLILGESGQSVVSAGLGEVVTDFDKRGLRFYREREYASPNYYRTLLNDEKRGHILAEMSASESPA